MKTFTDLNGFNRYVKPICAILGALVILYGGATNPNVGMYLIISLFVLGGGLLFYRKEQAE
jgi:APA family basic amino acid/polyamine antiporter